MELDYHRLVAGDIAKAIKTYREAGFHIEEKFLSELSAAFVRIGQYPERCHFDTSGRRRFNLRSFPYHVLFVVELQAVRIMMVRHNRQNPSAGSKRH